MSYEYFIVPTTPTATTQT